MTTKKKIKSLLGRIIFALRLERAFLKGRGLIVAFHRVNDDDDPGAIACTSSEFRAFCRFLARHFDVVPLEDFLDRLRSGRPIAGLAVITFDDGYEDNSRVAAPILQEYGLPATFFVSTDFIESSQQTFWDEADGVESKWMSWDDVRRLRSNGFSLGCHTANHVDLGKIDVGTAERELASCLASLREKTGQQPMNLFAYPFGGPENIREETLTLVRAAGFECCLSCFGGLVNPDDDPFRLHREPITKWHESPYQFALEMLLR